MSHNPPPAKLESNVSMAKDYRRTENVVADSIPPSERKQCILFYSPPMEELAQKIVLAGEGSIKLGNMRWKRFADGFPDLFVEDAMSIRNKHCAFLGSFHDPSCIFEQMSVIYALPRLFVGSFTLVLPFFPTGTLERVETEGDVATAYTLARIMSNVPPSRGGPTSLVIFDIHALQVTIAYPDEGAWKRFHYSFKAAGYPEVICTKVRDGDKRIVKIKEGLPAGRHVIIVDDLVQSGGTLLECHAVLVAGGATSVSAYVTHGVFPKQSHLKFKACKGAGAAEGFRYFWLTDSCPQTVEAVKGRAPFEVLSLASPIAAALQI
eukprot:gene7354-477_t